MVMLGGQVKLRVAVLNEALSLRAHDVVREVQHTWRGRRPRDRRDRVVVLRRQPMVVRSKPEFIGERL